MTQARLRVTVVRGSGVRASVTLVARLGASKLIILSEHHLVRLLLAVISKN